MVRLPTGPDLTPTYLYNPTKEDFSCIHANDDNTPQTYTLPSRHIVTLPKYLADHVGRKLAQKMALEEDSRLAYEIRFNKALEKIIVKL